MTASVKPFRERASGSAVAGGALLLSVAVVAGEFVVPLRHVFGSVLIHTSRLTSDAILNAGILEWVFRTMASPGRSVFDFPAGFPFPNTLAAGENLFGWQLLYAPLRFLGAGIDFSYNSVVLFSLAASCVGAALLARRFGASAAGSLFSGVVFAFAPFHVSHALHIQTMAAAGLPFVFLLFERYLDAGRAADAALLGAAAVLTALGSSYFGVFLLLMLPVYAALDSLAGPRRLDAGRLAGLAMTGAVCGFLLLPLARHYIEFGGEFGYRHGRSTLSRFSLTVSSFFRFPAWERLWSGTRLAHGEDVSGAFPGLAACALALLAFVRPAGSRDAGSRRRLLLAAALVSLLFALGPDLRIRGGRPIPLPAWAPLPGRLFLAVNAVRWPMRMYFFTLLFGGVLAGLGLTRLAGGLRGSARRAVETAAIVFLLLEFWPRSGYALGRSSPLAPPLELSDAYPFLASERDRGGVVELPVADPDGYRTPLLERYVFASTGHRRRVVAFSGAVPLPPVDNLLAAALRLPSPPARRFLAANGVDRVVVHRSRMAAGEGLCAELRRAGLPVLFDGAEATVFDLGRTDLPAGRVPVPGR